MRSPVEQAAEMAVAPVVPALLGPRLLRQGLLAGPVVVSAATVLRGVDGGISAAVGLALALANLLAAARSLDWAAGISLTLVAAVALGGYVARLAAITAAVLLLGHLAWVDVPALGVTLAVAHLGLVTAEARVT
jgi:hypothetical protein